MIFGSRVHSLERTEFGDEVDTRRCHTSVYGKGLWKSSEFPMITREGTSESHILHELDKYLF